MVRKYSVDWIGGSVLDWKYFKADLFFLRFQQILDTFPKQTLFALVIDDQQGDDDSNGDDIRIKYINQVQGASRPLQNWILRTPGH